ncbi:MAG TPA: LytTR family DNA-binding domain-containing protein [Cellvibrionaceae bacterium]
MKALIVEDSRLARVELKKMLQIYNTIEVCAEAANPRDALPIIVKERPDLLFLDINMPGKNGFELLQELDYEPKVIFITAHADYALRSFEFATVDYLLKPVTAERLKTAIDKLVVLNIEAAVDKADILIATSRVLLRDGEECHWVCVQDIHYFESVGNHTQVTWKDGKALIYRALVKIEERLPSDIFFRANRQHIVNINDIKKVSPWFNGGYKLQLNSAVEIEISRRHAMRFKDIFSL